MGMSTAAGGRVEGALRRVLRPVFVLSGAVVLVGFFFPEVVGDVVSGRSWLVVALTFFGSGLGYLALLPMETDGEADGAVDGRADLEAVADDGPVGQPLMAVRRLSVVETGRTFYGQQDRAVFWLPVGGLAVFIVAQTLFPEATLGVIRTIQGVLLADLGWLFVVPMFVSVLFCLWVLVGPWGDVRLGGPDAEPTYTLPVYFTMFFTAGIAAGIVFWGPAESLFHYDTPPPFFDVEPRSGAAITGALAYALFHWGFSAWSAYVILGLPIAYYVHERDAPLRVSSVLTPFLGVDDLDSGWGRFVDVLAIFATVGGIATSVAFVSQQFLTGIDYQWGVPFGRVGAVVFVVGLTAIFAVSAQSGVHRGIRRIAVLNVVLFGVVALLLVAFGPRSFVLERGSAAVASYAVNFVPMSFHLGTDWAAAWTVWNWIWWFSWAPFAGLFLAALSRGRRVRTVVLVGFGATATVTMLWFLLIGGTAVHLQHTGAIDVLAAIDAHGTEAIAGFPILEALPLGQFLVFLFLALIIVFMTTSADTSTLVVAILATRHGVAPTTGAIVFWGVFQGIVAAIVLLTGAADVIQAAAVLTGGPIAIISIVAIVGLTGSFLNDERGRRWIGGGLRDAVRSRFGTE